MKIYRNNKIVPLSFKKIKEYEFLLRNSKTLVFDSEDHVEHISLFFAWKNVGGNVFVKSPHLTGLQSENILKKVNSLEYENAIIFHTSGTTNNPKISVQQNMQLGEICEMSNLCMKWEKNSKYLNFVPAFTVGFWYIVLPSIHEYEFDITLGSRETIQQDFRMDNNITGITPTLFEEMCYRKINPDFSKFSVVAVGSSKLKSKNVDFFFSNKGKKLTHVYGATEFGTPFIKRELTQDDEDSLALPMRTISKNSEIKFIDDVLYIKSKSLCSNVNDLEYDDGWFKTNDQWTINNNLMTFKCRTNDIAKVNGFQVNLTEIENCAEEILNLGDCLCVVNNRLGFDFIELKYTNQIIPSKKSFEKYLPKYSLPKKFTKVDFIPKNFMGKKIRT